MDQLFRLKDSFIEYLSPKRRRTVGPAPTTPSSSKEQEHVFILPVTDPQDNRVQNGLLGKLGRKYWSPSEKNPRKRVREEDDGEDAEDNETVDPDDSISQVITSAEESDEVENSGEDAVEEGEDIEVASVEDEEGDEVDVEAGSEEEKEVDVEVGTDEEDAIMEYTTDEEEADVQIGTDEESVSYEEEADVQTGTDEESVSYEEEAESGSEQEAGDGSESEPNSQESEIYFVEEEEIEEEEPEISAEAKVEEYLARQAELALRKEEIEKAKAAGDWHADELFLFERLSLRSFEELIPQDWKIDFPTLPEILFTKEMAHTFVNYNCSSSYRGKSADIEALDKY
jgi:hypothetical protein